MQPNTQPPLTPQQPQELTAPQRSQEWFDARIGKFTASRISDLLTPKLKVADNQTSRDYILEKAIELAYNYREEEVHSRDLDRGTELEPLAFAKFNEIHGPEFIQAVPCGFIIIDANSGASPDGRCSDRSGLQIKCPRPKTFFRLVMDGVIDFGYQCQMNFEMLALDTDRCRFFNYVVINGIEYTHEIMYYRDEVIVAAINQAISEAVMRRDENIIELQSKIKLG